MTGTAAYFSLTNQRLMLLRLKRTAIIIIYLLTILPGIRSFAQAEPEYDEIAIFLDVPKVGAGEIDAVIKGEEVFLPVTYLFDFLKIKNVPSPELDYITGFFINQDAPYRIDRNNNNILYGEELFELEPGDLIRTESNLYLRAYYFGKIFGLDCIFSFRNLTVTVETNIELPVIREMRQEELRKNLNRLKGEIKADTSIGRSYPMFHFGMADWSVISTEQINGPAETRLNLGLGAIIAGGEATASLNYNSKDPFTEKQQYYLWRYVNNDNRALRQVMAGKIATHATSSIYDPVVGVQFTNTPSTFRRSFGSYTLSDKTEPGWIVELYVNNVLVEYVKADASGFFTFEVPLVYGSSLVKLKFYGPWGEEQTSERNISIPFNFIPKNTFEYNVSAGIVEDSLHSRFSRTNVNYGLAGGVTIGTGFEYLSSVSSGPMMPFVTGSFRLASNLLLSGEYTHNVRAKGTLTYRLPSNIQFDLNYTKYDKDQKAINYNYREERRASITMPIRFSNFSAYNRLSVNQLVLPTTKYTTAEWLLSGSLYGVNTNLTTYGLFIGETTPYVYSNLSLSFRIPADFRIIPQAQYSYTDKQFLSIKLGVEKRLIKHGFFNLSFEQNFRSNLRMGELGFRYNFNFAQTGVTARRSDNKTTLVQYARGSIISDRQTNYIGVDKRNNVGKGGITILPYIDKNANGTRDFDEPKAYGLNLRASGGRIIRRDQDTTIRILNLEPYTECFIELDLNRFDNIAYRLNKRTMSVAVNPNMLKLIEVPIIVVGEASGMVMIEREGESQGLARIIVNVYTNKQKLLGRTLTEQDGYFSYFGLTPGAYNIRLDTAQLRKLDMISSPDSIDFDITANFDGDYVDGLDFSVQMIPTEKDTAQDIADQDAAPEIIVTTKDTTYIVIHEVVQEVLTDTTDSYAIQLGAFSRKSNADAYRKRLAAILGKDVEIIIENELYKVRITGFETRDQIDEFIPILKENGIKEMWVINLKGMQKQWEIVTIQDTITEVIETITEMKPPDSRADLHLQVGAFRDSARATALRQKLSTSVDRPVIIVNESGYFKVRIAGFNNPEEREELVPSLNNLGISDIWIMPYNKSLFEPKTEPLIKEEVIEIETDSTVIILEEIPEEVTPEEVIPEEPRFSIQAGVFPKQSQANTAQRKISRFLKLPAIIVEEFDYYRVIIPGFYTREETYKYYPELTGLGYSNIYVIEKKK